MSSLMSKRISIGFSLLWRAMKLNYKIIHSSELFWRGSIVYLQHFLKECCIIFWSAGNWLATVFEAKPDFELWWIDPFLICAWRNCNTAICYLIEKTAFSRTNLTNIFCPIISSSFVFLMQGIYADTIRSLLIVHFHNLTFSKRLMG